MSPTVVLDRAAIAARIPHHGNMCLLDAVLIWDAERIVCRAISHREADNPLRAAGRLGVANGIEYAAQAMAVHGALLAAEHSRPKAGYLTSVRSISLHVDRLDTFNDNLEITAERQSGDDNSVLYSFSVSCAKQVLLSGRASAVLNTETLKPVV